MFTKFIYTSKIHLNQYIIYLFIDQKKLGLKIKKSHIIDDIYQSLEYYKTTKKKSVKVFDYNTADIEANKNEIL